MNETVIPWTRLAAFFRQHTHDVRNDLNSMDLEMEFLHDLASENEAKDSLDRIRKQLRLVEQRLRTLAALFHESTPDASPISASALLQIWREKHAALPGAMEVRWANELDAERVTVDEEMMAFVFKELLENALAFYQGTHVTVTGSTKEGEVIFEMREPKKEALNPSAWDEPFCSTRHGHYGLGLWAARRMAEANGASLQQHYDEKNCCLATRIRLKTCG